MALPFSFSYDSNGIFVAGPFLGFAGPKDAEKLVGGWSYSLPGVSTTTYVNQVQTGPHTFVDCTGYTSYIVYDVSGSRHSTVQRKIPSGNQPFPPKCPLSQGWQVDEANRFSILYNPSVQAVAARDGTVYSYFLSNPFAVEDSNGNGIQLATSYTQNPFRLSTFSATDDMGRTLISGTGLGHNGDTIRIAGLSNPYTFNWSQQSVNWSTQWTLATSQPPPGFDQCPVTQSITLSNTLSTVSAITLPNGEQYGFSYDPSYGYLNKITYPSGGYVSYVWGLNLQAERINRVDLGPSNTATCSYIYDRPVILHRYVSFDGRTVALQQDFSYSNGTPNGTPTQKSTTVTTRDLIRGTTSVTIYSSFDLNGGEGQIIYQDGNGNTLKTINKVWDNFPNNYDLLSESVTLDNGQTSKTTYTYSHGEVTEKDEYDFGQTTPTRKTITTYQVFPVSPLFPTASTHQPTFSPILNRPCSVVVYDGAGNRVAETDSFYDNAPSTTVCGPSGTPVVTAVSNLVSGTHDEVNYGPSSTAPRGNLTTLIKRCLPGCTDQITNYTYDETGQVTSITDPNGNITQYSRADSYTDSSPSGSTNARVTKITRPSTNGVAHVANFSYAYSDGRLTVAADENGLQTKYFYSDPLRRLTETDRPGGGKTTVAYNDAAPSPSVTTSTTINSTQTKTAIGVQDGMGHPTQAQLTSDPQGTIYGDTTYDGLGRVWKQSNPYRSGTDATTSVGTTTFNYDAIGRKISETEPDGSVITTTYCGPNTLATDPTGRWRRSRVDGLGRLVEVDEPNGPSASVNACPGTGEPSWVTTYGYDTLGNLTSVLQNGARPRSFTYDSLLRLLTSTNPEVGTITYGYDANSNVVTKKDARNITSTYTYDVLNRTKTVTYSNSDPSIAINYDEANCLGLTTCQNIGKRTSMTDAAGSEVWSFQIDAANKRSVHVNQRTTNSQTKTSTYYLDLAGNITQMIYPSGRIVNYTYDSANRPKTAADGVNGLTYATSAATPPSGCLAGAVCYTPQDSVYSMSIGQSSSFTGLNLTETSNNRLQPNEIKASSTGGNAFDLIYSYTDPVSGKNAGHVNGITNNLDTTRSQTFSYDQLNRIVSAQTTSTHATSPAHCWGETYGLDAWANLTSIAATTNSAYTGCSQESGFAQTADGNNHLASIGYDVAGNTTNDGTYQYSWNAESQLVWTSANAQYVYDGNGRRVFKTAALEPKIYWYGSGGEILTETNPSSLEITDYVYFGGKRIAQVANDLNLNGGFESGLQNWSASGSGTASVVNNSANAHSGNNYAELTTPAGGAPTKLATTQPISAQKGETVTMTGWVYREVGGQQYSRWGLWVAGSNGAASGQPVDNTTIGAWVYETASVTIPTWLQGPYSVTIWAEVDSTSTTLATSARFDDATLNGNTVFFAEDSLGTTRVLTDTSGVVCYDADFYPYGGERTPYVNNCTSRYKFEGKERDTETGNDNFGARNYSNRFGRWLSADWSSVPAPIPYANLTNPQTLNLYSMVHDDPESFADLDGHTSRDVSATREGCLWASHGDLDSCYEDIMNDIERKAQDLQTQAENQERAIAAQQAAQTQNQSGTASPALKGPFIADLNSPEIAPLLDPNHKPSNSDIVGNGECVSACKKFAGLEGTSTDQWRAGPKVVDDKDIKPGTAIATFDSNGRYPGKGKDKNSAIYLGRGANGSIWILDQWPARPGTQQQAHPPQPRELLPGRANVSNDSNAYYVIFVAPR